MSGICVVIGIEDSEENIPEIDVNLLILLLTQQFHYFYQPQVLGAVKTRPGMSSSVRIAIGIPCQNTSYISFTFGIKIISSFRLLLNIPYLRETQI